MHFIYVKTLLHFCKIIQLILTFLHYIYITYIYIEENAYSVINITLLKINSTFE